MQLTKHVQIAFAIAASSLLPTTFSLPARAAALRASPATETTASHINQVAQASDTCRRISGTTALNVYQDPSSSSTALGVIEPGRNVTIEGSARNGWVAISAPLAGYMTASSLIPCSAPKASIDRCRKVSATGGLRIRQEPSTSAEVLGLVANGRNVTIQNRGDQGWVPIEVPLEGYVAADYLVYCS